MIDVASMEMIKHKTSERFIQNSVLFRMPLHKLKCGKIHVQLNESYNLMKAILDTPEKGVKYVQS